MFVALANHIESSVSEFGLSQTTDCFIGRGELIDWFMIDANESKAMYIPSSLKHCASCLPLADATRLLKW